MGNPVKIIIDTDPGVDDAIAIPIALALSGPLWSRRRLTPVGRGIGTNHRGRQRTPGSCDSKRPSEIGIRSPAGRSSYQRQCTANETLFPLPIHVSRQGGNLQTVAEAANTTNVPQNGGLPGVPSAGTTRPNYFGSPGTVDQSGPLAEAAPWYARNGSYRGDNGWCS